jgi:hypothetical protein
MHLLGDAGAPPQSVAATSGRESLEDRVRLLEERVAALEAKLA